MSTYHTLTSNVPDLKRRVNAIARKLAKYNLACTFNILSTEVQLIPHYTEVTTLDGRQIRQREDDIPAEVTTYEFSMPELKLSGWTLVAIISHGQDKFDQPANIVTPVDNMTEYISTDWHHISATCEHCSIKRRRNKTVMLRNENGDMKQVGTTCIREFTGIDAASVIGAYDELHAFMDSEVCYIGGTLIGIPRYIETVKYLADSIAYIREFGYEREGVTAQKAWGSQLHTQKDLELAAEIISFFGSDKWSSLSDNFYQNIARALAQPYSKITGFVAYAPIAYEDLLASLNRQKQADDILGNFVGTVGKKLDINAKYSTTYTRDTMWGIMYIHKFIDADNNVLVWNTEISLDESIKNATTINIVGTVKAHITQYSANETILTRCKIKVVE